MKKLISIMLMVTLVVSLLTACSSTEKETQSTTANNQQSEKKDTQEKEKQEETEPEEEVKEIELSFTWWGAEARHEYTQELGMLFAEQNPGVTIDLQPNSWSGYWEKLAAQAAADMLPTVMQFWTGGLANYASNDMLLDLQPYVDDGTLDVSKMDPNLLKTGMFEGKLVTIPLSMSARAMVCSPVALKAAGMELPSNDWTWDDFVEMSKTYTEKTGKYAVDGYSNHSIMMELMLRQQGYALFNEDGSALGFEDETPLLAFYVLWDELLKAGAVYSPDVSVTREQIPSNQSYIALDESAFHYNSNTYPGWAENQNLKLIAAPCMEKGVEVNWVIPSTTLSVSSSADDATAKKAVELISWWLNSDDVVALQGTDRGFPASTSAQEYLNSKDDLTPLQADTIAYFTYLKDHSSEAPPTAPVGSTEVTTVAKDTLERMLFGNLTPEEAAQTFFEESNKILERYN